MVSRGRLSGECFMLILSKFKAVYYYLWSFYNKRIVYMYLTMKVTRLRPKVFSPKVLKESALGDFLEVRYCLFKGVLTLEELNF